MNIITGLGDSFSVAGPCLCTLCLSHYVIEISHLYSLRDFWRHFGLCRAAAHSDCCFCAPCTNILTYLLTYCLYSNCCCTTITSINDILPV